MPIQLHAPRWIVVIALLLAAMLAACDAAATPTPQPPAITPPPPSATSAPTHAPVPQASADPYAAFAQSLKTALESDDDAALKKLIGTPWFTGRYRSPLTQYADAAEAVAAFNVISQRVIITVEPERAAAQLTDAQKLGDRVVVARWDAGGGREELAYLYVSQVNGEWRWMALLTGVPADSGVAQATAAASPTRAVTPGTPTRAPTPFPMRGRLVFARANGVYARDLATGAETVVTEATDTSQWNWLRDGTRAAFVRGTGTAGEIWTYARSGGALKRLTTDSQPDGAPHWSPDGTQIVYEHNLVVDPSSGFKIKGEIWAMNADGANKRKFADGFDPAWSPDGTRIAFASNPSSVSGDATQWLSYARNEIRVMNAQGRNAWSPIGVTTASGKFTPLEWQMSSARLVDDPQWSPDSKELTVRVHAAHGAYVTTNATSGGFGRFIALFYSNVATGFSYSPDNRTMALSTGGLSGYRTLGIYRRADLGADGVGAPLRTLGLVPRQPADVPQSVTGYAWASDGLRVAYALVAHSMDPAKAPAPAGIWVMDIAAGVSQVAVTDGTGPLAWLP
ncbi:MAG: PD40 domain-containing protein [Chloroflexi bacterium]|nr:PD40 domain-containing protein [Chloroflexota bacterium]